MYIQFIILSWAGGQRNWIQVISNGGPAAILAIFYVWEVSLREKICFVKYVYVPVAQCVNRCVRNGSIFIIVNNTNIKKCLFEMKSSTTDV